MAAFDIAYKRLTPIEGGFSDNKSDRGGATNYGLSSKFLNSCDVHGSVISSLDINHDGFIDREEIEKINPEDAKNIYKIYFWQSNRYGELSNQSLANNVFDFAVHAGAYKSNIILQQSINKLSIFNKINVDGICGDGTINAANRLSAINLFNIFKDKRREFYKGIVEKNPSQSEFLKGWLKRVDAC